MSSSGLVSAFSNAACERFSPSDIPDPNRQRERVASSAETRSSKPTLMIPGRTTKRMTALIDSEIMRSAAANASWIPFLARMSSPIRPFSKVTRAFANTASSLRASSACCRRLFPSKLKGMVANITTKAFSSRAMRVINGAAPEPVPPPKPTHKKMIWCPRMASLIDSSDS